MLQVQWKISLGHKCKERELKELQMFVVRPDNTEEEIAEEDDYGQKELHTMELKEELGTIVELCINSVGQIMH